MTYFSDVTLQLVGGLEVQISFKEGLVNFLFSLKTRMPFLCLFFHCPSFFNFVATFWFYCSPMNSLLLQILKEG